MSLSYLPPVIWAKPQPVVTSPVINEVARPAEDRQATVVAEHAPIRTIYGEDRIGAQIANIAERQGKWLIQAIWCEGEIESIADIRFGDAEMPVGVVATHYNGTAGQTVDATLAAAIAGYADALPGIAYSVFLIPADAVDGFPQITATIKGCKVYDPRTTLTAWSDNPALILRDFLVRAADATVHESSVIDAADACDELVSGSKRRTLGLTLDGIQEVGQWIDVLRTYAGVWLTLDNATIKFVTDRPRAVDTSIAHDAGQIQSIRLKKRGMRQVPTVVRIRYTDTSAIPWRDEFEEADTGASPRRESEVALPGIHSASQAKREAIERLNKLNLGDLTAEVEVFDEGMEIEPGDVVSLSHPYGPADKPMRVLAVSGEYGRYTLSLAEYDAAMYSDAVASEPTSPDTDLPNPLDLPALTGLTATEELVQLDNGTWSSRIRMSWDAPTYPFFYRYNVVVERNSSIIDTRVQRETSYATPPVQEGVEYVCKVAALSSVGAIGTYAQANITPLGKYLPPQPIPANSLQAFEAGGTVFLEWGQAVDIDVWRYRVKRGTTAQTYAQATQIDLVDALRYMDRTAPVGTWRYWVDVVDSVQLESGTPRYKDVVVTSDANAFLVDSYDQTAPTLTNIKEWSIRADTNRYFVTEDGVGLSTKMTGALSAYTGALANQHASITSTWLGEAEDFGMLLGGQWTGTATVAAIGGSITSSMGFSPDASAWTYKSGLSQKENARFVRLKHETTGSSTQMVTIPTQNIRLDAIPREEVGAGTSSASGAVTVTLANSYVSVKKLTITPEGSTARMAVYDSIVVGTPTTFQVHIFNDAGARIASPFRYEFQGV